MLASVRDYAPLVAERPRVMSPQATEDRDGRAVTLQLWDWETEGTSYAMTMLFLREADGRWETLAQETRLHAHLREPLLAAAAGAGLAAPRWLEPAESGYYQPIVAGRA